MTDAEALVRLHALNGELCAALGELGAAMDSLARTCEKAADAVAPREPACSVCGAPDLDLCRCPDYDETYAEDIFDPRSAGL